MLMHPLAEEHARIAAEEHIPVITTGAGMPGKYIPMWKDAGSLIIPVVANVALAKRVEKVYGIELEREAVACADTLKEKNGLQNMTNICGKVEEKIFDVLEREQGKKLGLILDPPRAGIHRSVLEALKKSGIPRLVLISCNPATLARDLGILTGNLQEVDGVLVQVDGKGEYQIESIQPYDMFPQTKHVETIVCLRKQ
jgi:23S rRNA (uracil1939-C5)-methyltransferase